MSTTCSIASLYYNGYFSSYSKKVIIASEAILDGSCKLLHRIGQVQRQSTTMVVPEIIGRLQNYHTARHVPIKKNHQPITKVFKSTSYTEEKRDNYSIKIDN